jgi:hypothetical protein
MLLLGETICKRQSDKGLSKGTLKKGSKGHSFCSREAVLEEPLALGPFGWKLRSPMMHRQQIRKLSGFDHFPRGQGKGFYGSACTRRLQATRLRGVGQSPLLVNSIIHVEVVSVETQYAVEPSTVTSRLHVSPYCGGAVTVASKRSLMLYVPPHHVAQM